jgi:hypothetical protein
MVALMALTSLMAGRLDEGLRGELRGGIKAGSGDITWHLGGWRPGDVGWPEAMRRSGNGPPAWGRGWS